MTHSTIRRTDQPLPLGTLGKGTRAEICALDESGIVTTLPQGELERRLIEMGFVEGARVEILHEGFPKRDPIAVRVNDHTVALRRSEAAAILVRHVSGKAK
ncbi:MAG: ferrous iron transport protein A [Magnetospirillum sp.]|nr:ferrous iron transport protein A [Magnetospirillum sp.]